MKHIFYPYALYRALLPIALLLLTHTLLAQTYHNRLYNQGHDLLLFSGITQHQNQYYVTGIAGFAAGQYGKVFCGRLDSSLQFTYHTVPTIGGAAYTFLNTLVKTGPDEWALTGYNIAGGERLLLVKLSNNLDSIKTISFLPPYSNFRGMKLLPGHNGTLYTTGLLKVDTNANVFINKIDAAGNALWQTQLGDDSYEFAKSIGRLPNNNLVLGAVKSRRDTLQNALDNTWLIEVDTLGHLVKEWADTSNLTGAAESIIITSDKHLVYGVQKTNVQTSMYRDYTAAIIKRDTAFNLLWEYTGPGSGDYNAISDIEELPDGSLIACGQKLGYYTNGTILGGWVLKLSAGGQLLWSKVYSATTNNYTQNYLTDIDVLDDGSLVAVGDCVDHSNTPAQQGWILKLDSNGCENSSCTTGVTALTETGYQLKIAPSPADSFIQVKYDGNNKAGKLTVINSTGYKVLETALPADGRVNVSHLLPGTYVAQLAGNNYLAKSTFVINR